jgi:hypothetical protein
MFAKPLSTAPVCVLLGGSGQNRTPIVFARPLAALLRLCSSPSGVNTPLVVGS